MGRAALALAAMDRAAMTRPLGVAVRGGGSLPYFTCAGPKQVNSRTRVPRELYFGLISLYP
jgi:hypothetical protein